jgi:hypothetical protein
MSNSRTGIIYMMVNSSNAAKRRPKQGLRFP